MKASWRRTCLSGCDAIGATIPAPIDHDVEASLLPWRHQQKCCLLQDDQRATALQVNNISWLLSAAFSYRADELSQDKGLACVTHCMVLVQGFTLAARV